MNGTRATVEFDYAHGTYNLRLGRHRGGGFVSVLGPDGMWHDQDEAVAADPFVTLDREALEALRDALNGHIPPTDDADLRDALAVERARVDRIIGRALTDTDRSGA